MKIPLNEEEIDPFDVINKINIVENSEIINEFLYTRNENILIQFSISKMLGWS